MLKKSTRVRLSQIAKKFFPSDSLLPAFIGAIVISVLGNAATQLPNGWAINDVISDFTGMTSQASIGMAIACMTIGGELQYTPAQMVDGKLTGESLQPIAVTHKNSQFMQLP